MSGEERPPLLTEVDFQIHYGPTDDRLHRFYIPALERSVRYDRTAGFFSSGALAVAATGVVRLIENGGRMRLLCGAQLSEKDVEAISKGQQVRDVVGEGMLATLEELEDVDLKSRLEILSWMVAHDLLEIKVVLPRDKRGLPLPDFEALEYYHPKEGVFEDPAGNKLAFSGSSNESINGWKNHYEVVQVYASWDRTTGDVKTPALPGYITGVESRFRRLWEGQEKGWISMDVPSAVKERLLHFCPDEAPKVDPLEKPERVEDREVVVQREAIRFQYLRDAPKLLGFSGTGAATCTVTPWPHQTKVYRQTVESFPRSYLFCDEVGLGKTIEAGLVLRELVLSGRVKRALLLVPASVLRQWQEELYEKFVLNIPRYTSGEFRDVFDEKLDQTDPNPWNSYPLLLASSQLAKRRDRQSQILEAEPWDLLLVDEAHHARRKGFRKDEFRPNRLLELLVGRGNRPGLRDRCKCIYLLTATPMQVNPIEVWDLLKVVGLGGMWAASEENYLTFFGQIRESFAARDWDFLMNMVSDYLKAEGEIDEVLEKDAKDKIGLVQWDVIKNLPSGRQGTRSRQINSMQPVEKAYVEEFLKRHNPLAGLVWRNTRDLLRKYRKAGLLDATVPTRKPRNEWIEFEDGEGGERSLYERIDEYISNFYHKYESEKKGLGFVMTVYRKRLTSSFYSLRMSLERRKKFLQGACGLEEMLDPEDLEELDLDEDISEQMDDYEREMFRSELEYVEGFIRDIVQLPGDSKYSKLEGDLRYFFRRRDKVIVFTQYADTMDYLRERLRPVYGSQVACYSGRGGERWTGSTWENVSKEVIKNDFLEGRKLKILLCTESASEGLNLQTCGILINFDMPWNPMRVEQRIGRIDRIGQQYEEVWVRNYFYKDTVEADVYRALSDRIDWFETVVGDLQPILQQVKGAIEKAALSSREERSQILEDEIARIRESYDDRSAAQMGLTETLADQDTSSPGIGKPAVSLEEIEEYITSCSILPCTFSRHEKITGAWVLDYFGKKEDVTFRPEVFDAHPYSLKFLTYGEPLFDEILDMIQPPNFNEEPEGLARISAMEADAHCYYGQNGKRVGFPAILDYSIGEEWGDWEVERIEEDFRNMLSARLRLEAEVLERRNRGKYLAALEEARIVLQKLAYLEMVGAKSPDFFDGDGPLLMFSSTIESLKRFGKPPYRALIMLSDEARINLDPTNQYYLRLQKDSRRNLSKERTQLEKRGLSILKWIGSIQGEFTKRQTQDRIVYSRWLCI